MKVSREGNAMCRETPESWPLAVGFNLAEHLNGFVGGADLARQKILHQALFESCETTRFFSFAFQNLCDTTNYSYDAALLLDRWQCNF